MLQERVFFLLLHSFIYLFILKQHEHWKQMGQDYKYTGEEKEAGELVRGGGAGIQANPRRQKINNSTPCCVRETLNV